MNTNPNAISVLCFGDSNTFGQRSDDVSKGRWPADVRWTGVLQNLLGSDYYVIEEGLSSRTTDLEYYKPGRNGKPYFLPCLDSHKPDSIILMLGTNDAKTQYSRTAEQIAQALISYFDDIATAYTGREQPKVILVSPILIDDTAQNFAQIYSKNYDHQSAVTSTHFAEAFRALAEARGCTFFDASTVAEVGEDGIHLSKESHARLARALAGIVKGE